MLLPFWSSALPTLPVKAPSKKESDAPEGRTRQKSSRMVPTKILLAKVFKYLNFEAHASEIVTHYAMRLGSPREECSEYLNRMRRPW
jgi:hypothetical protein